MSLKQFIIIFVLSASLIVPMFVSAQTVLDIQAQITALQQGFHDGDRVQTSVLLNVRSLPSTGAAVITKTPAGSTGTITCSRQGTCPSPTTANGYTWWYIQWDAGYTGWSAEGSSEADFLQVMERNPIYCTQEVQQCPGGSYVGRVPPSCLFAACPTISTKGTIIWAVTLNGAPWTGTIKINGKTPVDSPTNYPVPTGTYPNAPIGTYTYSYVSGGPAGAILQSITPSATQTLSANGAITFTFNFVTTSASANTKLLVLLAKFQNTAAEPYSKSYMQGQVFTNSDSVKQFYEKISYNRMSIIGDVLGWYTIPDVTNGTCNTEKWMNDAESIAQQNGVNVGQYTNVIIAFPDGDFVNSGCKLAGAVSLINVPPRGYVFASQVSLISHEFGHTLGLAHASGLDCGQEIIKTNYHSACIINEYGDPFDFMGISENSKGKNLLFDFNGPHRIEMGWLLPANIQSITANGTFVIHTLETSSAAVQVLKIKKPDSNSSYPTTQNDYYYVDYNPGVDYDTGKSVDGVAIRIWNQGHGFPTLMLDITPKSCVVDPHFPNGCPSQLHSDWNDGMLKDGMTFVDNNGIRITQVSHTNTEATVTVAFPSTKTSKGTIIWAATLNGAPWTGTIKINGKTPVDSPTNYPVPTGTYPNAPIGTYTYSYVSGGPAGAMFQNITPSGSQMLSANGTITFTFNFTTTTNSSTQTNSSTPPPPSSSTPSTPSTPSTSARLQVGDSIVTNRALNVRSVHSLLNNTPTLIPQGTTGIILQGPVSAEGYDWYQVKYNIGASTLTGWSADIGLDKTNASLIELYTSLYRIYSHNLTTTPGDLSQALIDINSPEPLIANAALIVIRDALRALSVVTASPLGIVTELFMGLLEYLLAPDLSTGYWNNPIKGALYSNATAGVQTANLALDLLYAAGLDNIPTVFLVNQVAPITNSIMPYYATAQGGVGAIRASDTVTGGYGSVAEYTANFTRAQSRLAGVVNNLLKRGVMYEELGKLPVSLGWESGSLDLSNPLGDFYWRGGAKYDADLVKIEDVAGIALYGPPIPGPSWPYEFTASGDPYPAIRYNSSTALLAAQGSDSAYSPQDLEKWQGGGASGGNIAPMYGGAMWLAFARMNLGGQETLNLIQQHFDPWARVRAWSPSVLVTTFAEAKHRLDLEAAGNPPTAP